MNTIISEQRREIAIMKAIGATRAKIFGSFISTSLLLGGIGALAGTLLGTILTHFLLLYFGGLLGFDAVFSIHFQTVLLSLFGGILLVVASSLPAIFKGLAVCTREGLDDNGISSDFGKGLADRILLRSRWLPRTIQLGFRNSSRRKGRSIATVLQVSLAVGIFLGLVSFGYSVGVELTDTIDNVRYDIVLRNANGGEFLPSGLSSEISHMEGVDSAEPFMETRFTMKGIEIHVMGYQPDTEVKLHERTMIKGKWFNGEQKGENVAVMGEQLAGYSSISVGDMINVMTPTGPADIEIIGIDSDFYYMGMILYMPMAAVQFLSSQEGNVSGFHIDTADESRSGVDGVAVSLEDGLASSGYDVETEKKYRIVEGTISQNRSIINMMAATSLIIILISLVGLTSNLTMNILDRTREIGVMRCMGSVASKIRTMFTTEVLTLSILGWMLGVPVGFLTAKGVSLIIDSMIDWEIEVHYPVSYVVIGFFMVMIGSSLVAQFPILRATRIRPGDALRYQ
jgi:putative ABC transport system permease protein